ncbi:D-Ala-D-Ala carboxypeptidase family metallohydrolase [Massilia endophytica]|uniref:D-Ala-D-Ala carboxypeptidase family metallohydrolase n=1 Tax=Massilia endophytica TaxID=2899220 RepID=UPI001E3C20EC|nr:D-Ala-D-Ala carboxypeptidase family metallohydrolase [Massilia endophytica]UGQ45072.1 D-Ala-D-Ala carboxypeptidase family metallohydrolase [Massilia endophytica]
MKLTEHFTLEELTESQIAVRHRLDNRPGPAALANLRRLAALLEQVRAVASRPIAVSSGYRSPAVNAAVGGAGKSAHLLGLAADITAPGMTPKELARVVIDAGVVFDQLIFEGTWVHIALSEGPPRGQVLTAVFVPGGVVYERGIV